MMPEEIFRSLARSPHDSVSHHTIIPCAELCFPFPSIFLLAVCAITIAVCSTVISESEFGHTDDG